MEKVRRALVVGIGTITPAFILPNTAQAASNPTPNKATQGGTSTAAFDQGALKNVLFALSPAEKLRIAGDRIRLSETALQGGSPSRAAKPGVPAGTVPQSNTNPVARCTIFQGPKGPAQGPAMGPSGGGATTIEKRR